MNYSDNNRAGTRPSYGGAHTNNNYQERRENYNPNRGDQRPNNGYNSYRNNAGPPMNTKMNSGTLYNNRQF